MLKAAAAFNCRLLAGIIILGSLLATNAGADVLVSTYYGSSENSFGFGSVERFNETTGATTSSGQIYDSSLVATGIAQGPDGSIYVSNHSSGEIDHYTIGGAPLPVFATLPDDPNPSPPPASITAAPAALHFGPDGNLYVSDSGGSTIQRYNITTGQFMDNVVTGLSHPGGFTFARNGDLYVSDFGAGRVVKLDAVTHKTSNFVAAGSSPLQTPDGILIAPNGKVLVSDLFGNKVFTFDAQGNLLNQSTVPPAVPQGQSNYPGGMTLDRSGNVLLAVLGNDFNNTGTVLRYDTNGNQTGTNPFITNLPGASDLMLVSAQTNWNVNGGGSFGDLANLTVWDPHPVPNGIGASAVFGNGTTNTINAATAMIVIDGAYTVGSLLFTNDNGTQFTLASDGIAGHGITLNNGGIGAAVNVTSGVHDITAPLTLADSGGHNFFVATASGLTASGSIGESGGSQSLNKSGEGFVILSGASTFTGGTTVSNGTLILHRESGNATLAAGTTVTVSNTAILELDGSLSALGSATINPISVVNSSAATGGVHVYGTHQEAGGIDGKGSTVVEAGSDLTVGHINQSALVIGGTAGNPGTVIIAPYSPPMLLTATSANSTSANDSGGFALAGSLMPSGPFATDGLAPSGVTIGANSSSSSATGGLAGAPSSSRASNSGGGLSAVPEPSMIFLTLSAACGLLGYRVSRRRRAT